MSSLAREEQAAIPHVNPANSGTSATFGMLKVSAWIRIALCALMFELHWLAGGAPVVALSNEPDKRLSHKEVEQ